jgi:RND family efflux transporter MFP subunit
MNGRISLKVLLPVVVLAIGGGIAYLIVHLHPRAERRDVEIPPPLVRVVQVSARDVPLNVYSQGTVAPRTESTLVAEVSGRIESVSPAFAAGGFFGREERLIRIDPRDYRLAVSRAEAEVARARVRLDLERAEADVARQEWADLGEGQPTALTLREPQLAEAEAELMAAEAALDKARLDLSRTVIRGPFDGRIRDKRVDVGQFVSPGTPLATAYATDRAEIRLPVPKHDLGFLEIDLGSAGRGADGPAVLLRGEIGGEVHTWPARIVRTDSAFDPRTRMLDLFAQVEDPFRRMPGAQGPSLPIGMFVEAEIGGHMAEDVVVLPRTALRDGGHVLIVDGESRLRFRPVTPLRILRDQLVLRDGVQEGELVCVSVLETVVDGMRVRTVKEGAREDPAMPPEVEEGA